MHTFLPSTHDSTSYHTISKLTSSHRVSDSYLLHIFEHIRLTVAIAAAAREHTIKVEVPE